MRKCFQNYKNIKQCYCLKLLLLFIIIVEINIIVWMLLFDIKISNNATQTSNLLVVDFPLLCGNEK